MLQRLQAWLDTTGASCDTSQSKHKQKLRAMSSDDTSDGSTELERKSERTAPKKETEALERCPTLEENEE